MWYSFHSSSLKWLQPLIVGWFVIAFQPSCQMPREPMLHALVAAGIERRPAKVRMPPLIDDEVLACYVRERMSL